MQTKKQDEVPTLARELHKQAMEAMARGDLDRAFDLALEAVTQEPSSLEAHRLVHEIVQVRHRSAGNRNAGLVLGYAKKAAAMFTTLPHLGLGWAALKEDHPGKAMAQAYRMLASDPTNTQGLDLIIRAAQELDLYDVAALHAEKAVNESPDNITFLTTLARLYLRAKRPFEALDVYKRLLDLPERIQQRIRETEEVREELELRVAFIRLNFPPEQRDTAQQLAVSLSRVVGERIIHLRPECTIREILSWVGAGIVKDDGKDSLDAVEMIMSVEIEFQNIEVIDADLLDKTFREVVEYYAARQSLKP